MSFRLFALPLTLAADVITLGNAGMTSKLLQLEENDQIVEAVKALNTPKEKEK